jgi:hypothetical protein
MGLHADAIDLVYTEGKNLSRLAQEPTFQAAAARLGEIFNRKPAPWRRRKGIVYFHDASIVKHLSPLYGGSTDDTSDGERLFSLLATPQDQIRAEGFVLVYTDSIPRESGRLPLILLPTSNKYVALAACGTNGINHGHSRPEQIVLLAQQLSQSGSFGFWWD